MYLRESVQEGYGKTEDTIMQCHLNTGWIISVRERKIKTKGILVVARKKYIKVFGAKIFINSCCFSL